MFFFIDWKLPPPACPGTTGMYTVYNCISRQQESGMYQFEMHLDLRCTLPASSLQTPAQNEMKQHEATMIWQPSI